MQLSVNESALIAGTVEAVPRLIREMERKNGYCIGKRATPPGIGIALNRVGHAGDAGIHNSGIREFSR